MAEALLAQALFCRLTCSHIAWFCQQIYITGWDLFTSFALPTQVMPAKLYNADTALERKPKSQKNCNQKSVQLKNGWSSGHLCSPYLQGSNLVVGNGCSPDCPSQEHSYLRHAKKSYNFSFFFATTHARFFQFIELFLTPISVQIKRDFWCQYNPCLIFK